MAQKVLLRDVNKNEILPITRGELVLDSSGKQALHSDEFLATTSQPGLMSAADKSKIENMQAASVANALTLKINNGSTEGTNLYTFNGSVAKTLNIVAGDNITFTPSAGAVSISASIPATIDAYTKAESDNRYLNLSGGTLIGDLILHNISGSDSPRLIFQRASNIDSLYDWDLYVQHGGHLKIRRNSSGTWDEIVSFYNDNNDVRFNWPIIANLTGNVTGNATSATKLATPRTIWGQSFDGTANINGRLIEVDYIYGNYNNNELAPYIYQYSVPTNAGNLRTAVGIGNAPNSYGTYFWQTTDGKGHIQCGRADGTVKTYDLVLQEFGSNVGIGTTSPSEKLHVNGNVKATKFIGNLEGNATSAVYADAAVSLYIHNASVKSAFPMVFAGHTQDTNSYQQLYISNNKSCTFNPDTGVLTTTKFAGDLQGNADTATKATQDSDGKAINTTYVKKWVNINRTDLNDLKTTGFYNGYNFTNGPADFSSHIGTLIVNEYSDDWGSQIHHVIDENKLFVRTWHDAGGVMDTSWKQLAFTSDIPTSLPANGGIADKLSSSRYIWGQSFDGTEDVSGALSNATTGSFSSNVTIGGSLSISDSTTRSAKLMISEVGASINYMHIYVGTNNSVEATSRFLVLQKGYGNVGIGMDSPTEKLHVSGNVKATSFIGNIDGQYVNKLTNYTKATAITAIATTDSLNTALGKLELKADSAYELVKGAYDGDGTIENLAEILKVLEGIKDTETIQAIVGKYLPLTGGTLTGALKLDMRNSEVYSIHILKNGTVLSRLACYNYDKWVITDAAWSKEHILYHTGNLTKVSQLTNDSGFLTSHQSLANYVTLNGDQTITGKKTFSSQQSFTVAQGTAPFTVTSTTKVTNLNADLLDDVSNGDLTAKYINTQLLTASNSLDTINDGFYSYINADNPTNAVGHNAALFQISGRKWDRFQLVFPGNADGKIRYRSSTYTSDSSWSWFNWKTLAFIGDIPTKLSDLTNDLGFVTGGPYLPTAGGTMLGEIQFNITGLTYSDISTGIKAAFKAPRIQANELIANYIYLGASSGSKSNLPLIIRKYEAVSSQAPATITDLVTINTDGNITATNLWSITTITKSITLSKDWKETGISLNPTNFPNGSGTYAVQVTLYDGNQGFWDCYFSGIMSVYTSYTNGSVPDDEIILHHGSHACSKQIYLKTKPTVGSNDYNKLHIACNTDCSSAINITFKFKKLI